MFLLLPCPGIIPAPASTYPASCRPSSSPPDWFGSTAAAPCRRSGRCTTAPTPSSAVAAAPSRCTSVPGRGRRCQPPEGLHYCGRRAQQPAPPQPTAGQAPRRIRRSQTGDVSTSLGLYAFNGAAAKRSRNRFPTQHGGFCTPWTGGAINVSTAAESAAPAESAAVSATPADTASEDGPLTSLPSRGQSSGGSPVEIRFVSLRAYLRTHGQYTCTYPYMNADVILNKPVMS